METAKNAEKLNRFIAAVNSAADKQAAEIIDGAEEERRNILSAAKSLAEEEKERSIRDNLKMASGRGMRMISKAQLEMKKEILICREKLTDKLFEDVISKLTEYRKSKEYEDGLCRAVSGEETQGAQILLSPEDMRLSSKIKKAAGKGTEIISDETIRYGGFRILYPDKGIILDRTFDSALKAQRRAFAAANPMSAGEGEKT